MRACIERVLLRDWLGGGCVVCETVATCRGNGERNEKSLSNIELVGRVGIAQKNLCSFIWQTPYVNIRASTITRLIAVVTLSLSQRRYRNSGFTNISHASFPHWLALQAFLFSEPSHLSNSEASSPIHHWFYQVVFEMLRSRSISQATRLETIRSPASSRILRLSPFNCQIQESGFTCKSFSSWG